MGRGRPAGAHVDIWNHQAAVCWVSSLINPSLRIRTACRTRAALSLMVSVSPSNQPVT